MCQPFLCPSLCLQPIDHSTPQHSVMAMVLMNKASVGSRPTAALLGSRPGPSAAWPTQLAQLMAVMRCHYQRPAQHVLARALAADSPVAANTAASTPDFGLPLPDARFQKSMDIKEIKALRTIANTAVRNKELKYIQVGQNGVTLTFLSAAMDILGKHEYVRVRLGEGSGVERKEAAEALSRLLDCVVVQQIGFTITLYRRKGLPRPSNCILASDAAHQEEQTPVAPVVPKPASAAKKTRQPRARKEPPEYGAA